MNLHVSSHHRLTIEKIFHHPAGGNVEWRQVLAMLEDLGTVTQEHNGKFTVTLGPETEVFEVPRGKDIDEQVTVDVRRMLRSGERKSAHVFRDCVCSPVSGQGARGLSALESAIGQAHA
ncbi:MAG TPA: hypothetical protein VIM14_14135 [Polyangia bacterium]